MGILPGAARTPPHAGAVRITPPGLDPAGVAEPSTALGSLLALRG